MKNSIKIFCLSAVFSMQFLASCTDNVDSNEPLDYLVAYQAGFLVRLFACEPAQRFEFLPVPGAADKVLQLMLAGQRPGERATQTARQFATAIAQWSLMNLRSLPIGMRIDHWLRGNYPDLREQQIAGVENTLDAARNVVGQRVGALSVPPVLLGMDAAYALFAERLLGLDGLTVPYQAAGALETGQDLLGLFDESSVDPANDRDLVDTWARLLGMTGWYHWQHYEP